MQAITQEPWLLAPDAVVGVYQMQSPLQEEADMAAHPVGAAVVVAGGLVGMGPQVPPWLLLDESVHLQRVVVHWLVVMKVLQASTQPAVVPAAAYQVHNTGVPAEHSLWGLLAQPAGAAVVVGAGGEDNKIYFFY